MKFDKPLFTDKYLAIKRSSFTAFQIPAFMDKLDSIRRWKESIDNRAIDQSKEESLKAVFLQQFFVEILGYSHQKDSGRWSLEFEQKTNLDSTKMDGALGFFTLENEKINADVRAVIELKDAKTDLDKPQNRQNDKRTPVQQAFDYANAVGEKCHWVIVSNFKEIRLYYHTDRTRYQHFDILNLDKDENFITFYFLLNKGRLINEQGDSLTDKLYQERQAAELEISKQFYNIYKQARLDFFESLKKIHPEKPPLVLLNKTQKLLDRIVFIHFCEDHNIIDGYTLRDLVNSAKQAKFNLDKDKIYRALKTLFSVINSGQPEYLEVNKFNGGLFAYDAEFNSLKIEDAILTPVLRLIDYDFRTDLDVNILGHIFEQSISDIEELKAQISGVVLDKKQGKRKKDGIYYTPDNITRYIVEEAIGGWLKERRTELKESELPPLTESDWQSIVEITQGKNKGLIKHNQAIQAHIDFYQAYKAILADIKILDPACGSGAFLNQAFDFLHKEGERVNKLLVNLLYPSKMAQINLEVLNNQLTKHILQHNLFGVDLNEESIEITKLSLWIKTANEKQELTSLDDNIKCGNSLIDDEKVAGNKAFVWEKEFKEIMEKGGFDVIIGNPPYATGAVLSQTEKDFYSSKFITAQYQLELYVLFIEKIISLLVKSGNIGLITPNSWLKNLMMSECRKLMLDNLAFSKIIPNISSVFEDASVDTLIFIANKKYSENNSINIYPSIEKSKNVKHIISQNRLLNNYKYVFDLEINDALYNTFNKINGDCLPISDLFYITRGINPYDKYTGQSEDVIKNKKYHADYKKDTSFVAELRGKHVDRYFYQWDGKHYISYGNWLAAPREKRFFTGERIVLREVLGKNNFVCTLITEDIKIDRTLYIALPKESNKIHIKYVLALLSSAFLNLYFRHISNEFDDLFPKIRIAEFNRLPIKNIGEKEQQPFIEKVDIMLEQNKNLQQQVNSFIRFIQAELKPVKISTKLQSYYQLSWDEFKTELKKGKVDLDKNFDLKKRREWQQEFEQEKQKALAIKNLIDQTDSEIDNMVYALYGLNENDIAIINGKA